MIFTAKVTQPRCTKKKKKKEVEKARRMNNNRVEQQSRVAMINSDNLKLCGIKSNELLRTLGRVSSGPRVQQQQQQ